MKKKSKILLGGFIIIASITTIMTVVDFIMVLKNKEPIFTFYTMQYGENGSKYSISLLYAISNAQGPKIPFGTGEQNLWQKGIVVFPFSYISIIYIMNYDKLKVEEKQKEMIQKMFNNK